MLGISNINKKWNLTDICLVMKVSRADSTDRFVPVLMAGEAYLHSFCELMTWHDYTQLLHMRLTN